MPYIVQGLLEQLCPLLQSARVQLDPPVSLVIQEAGQGHPVVRHVACHRKEAQNELPVCLLETAPQGLRALAFQSLNSNRQWFSGVAQLRARSVSMPVACMHASSVIFLPVHQSTIYECPGAKGMGHWMLVNKKVVEVLPAHHQCYPTL